MGLDMGGSEGSWKGPQDRSELTFGTRLDWAAAASGAVCHREPLFETGRRFEGASPDRAGSHVAGDAWQIRQSPAVTSCSSGRSRIAQERCLTLAEDHQTGYIRYGAMDAGAVPAGGPAPSPG